MSVKLRGIGPVKVGKVYEQFDFNRMVREYYFWFAGRPILLATEWLRGAGAAPR